MKRLKQFLQACITELSLFRRRSDKRQRLMTESNGLKMRFKCIETKVSEDRNFGGDLVLDAILDTVWHLLGRGRCEHGGPWLTKITVPCRRPFSESWSSLSDLRDPGPGSLRLLNDPSDSTILLCLYIYEVVFLDRSFVLNSCNS